MFKPGDLVRVKDTNHIRKWRMGTKAIGHEFYLREIGEEYFEEWIAGLRIDYSDPDNVYGINYYVSDLELVNPKETQYEIY